MFQVQQSSNLLYSDSWRKSVKNTGIRFSTTNKYNYKPIRKTVMLLSVCSIKGYGKVCFSDHQEAEAGNNIGFTVRNVEPVD